MTGRGAKFPHGTLPSLFLNGGEKAMSHALKAVFSGASRALFAIALGLVALAGCGEGSAEGPPADFNGYVVRVSGMT